MPLLEILMIDLGASISKSILKAWLKSDIASDGASSIIDTLKTWTTDRTIQKHAQRQLEEIGERVGEALLPIFEKEGANLDEGSRTAIALAVADTLNTLSAKKLVQYNLAPAELAQYLWDHSVGTDYFNDTELSLFQRIVSESCECIVDIASQFPAVTEHTFSEILTRQNYLLEIAKQTLEEVQRILKQADPLIESHEFETRYRRAVIRELDSLELFGIDLPSASRQHSLSTAYISLSLSRKPRLLFNDFQGIVVSQPQVESFKTWLADSTKVILADMNDESGNNYNSKILKTSPITFYVDSNIDSGKGTVLPVSVSTFNVREEVFHSWIKAKKDKDDIVTIEQALAGTQRLFIQGSAGSGKTTLLQWIAVNSARQSFQEPLTKWNKTVPFYVSLRHYVDVELPAPEEFPKSISPSLANTMPKGWVHQALKDGRAIILVDGLDEVSKHQREDVRKWLRDLVGNYPKAFFLITSRPGVVGKAWLDWIYQEGFSDAELQPMDLQDIRAFIDHWHRAVTKELSDEEEKTKLPTIANHLTEEITSSRALRTLATSPLLCAMLCALHRERREQLPSDRIKLYEVCCEMLIERRDSVRRISLSDYPAVALTYREKLALLEDLAYWMINNGWSEIELQKAEERIKRKLANMHNVPASIGSSDVLRLFIERTSLIREPSVGYIDFTHRTFQEYLAARAAINEEDTGILLKNAQDAQWQEVIVLAAGLATKKVREELLKNLIKRGDTEPKYRNQFYLLAISCLDTSVDLEENLREEVRKRLGTLVPPNSIANAKALAIAGELAIPYLSNKPKFSASAAAFCVRALATIGGAAALKVIEGYSKDTRQTVVKELLRAWDYFDRKDYAESILKHVLVIQNWPFLSIEAISYFPQLKSFHLQNSTIENLSPLANLTQLTDLSLSNCQQISDLSPLANLTQLTDLSLSNCQQVSDLSPLANLTQLTTLNLSNCQQVSDLSPLANLARLTYLYLINCTKISDLSLLANLTRLTTLDLSGSQQISGLSPLANLTRLTDLYFSNCQQISGLSPLANLTRLTTLFLLGCPLVQDLGPISDLKINIFIAQNQLEKLPDKNRFKIQYLLPIEEEPTTPTGNYRIE